MQSYIASNICLDDLPENTMMDILIKKMCKMYVKTVGISQIDIWQELPRFFMSCSFGVELLEFVYRRLYNSSEFDAMKCMYGSLYNQNYISIEHIVLLKASDRVGFLNAWVRVVGKCIPCIWSEDIREILKRHENICWDEISVKLFQMLEEDKETKELHIKQLASSTNNLDVFFREEYGILIFDNALECKDYKTAFKIYADMFFLSELSIMRMNTKKLNKRLHLGNCRLFYEEIDFCIYACNTELHYINANLPSEFVTNSVRKILKVNGVDRPSSLKIPKEPLDSWKWSYFLYYVCDLKMIYAIDIYDLEAIEERRRILMMVSDKYDCDIELKNLDKEEIRISMILEDSESMQMKAICANWIKISDDNFINSAMLEIKQQKMECLSVFRNLVIKCKDLYIETVNEKLGTTIRHCILEQIMLGTLTDYKVYIDKRSTIEKILNVIPELSKYDVTRQCEVQNYLSIFFDEFF